MSTPWSYLSENVPMCVMSGQVLIVTVGLVPSGHSDP